jgi:trehalose 6-phosphate phosphatase
MALRESRGRFRANFATPRELAASSAVVLLRENLRSGHSFVAAAAEEIGMTDAAFSSRRRAVRRGPPALAADDTALFLDLDGTLLDIAPTPQSVSVPEDLVADLAAASVLLDGALAIVSGRTLAELDRLLTPLHLPAAAEHGAVIRLPDGKRDEVDAKVPQDWVDGLRALKEAHSGVQIEHKAHSVVAHFRNAPLAEDAVRRAAAAWVAHDPERFESLAGKMLVEIRPRAARKGRAVCRFMAMAPFRGRKPVFVGDDVTDEDGFAAAVKLGGVGLHVAEHFGGEPREVRRWLKRFAQGC